MPTKKMPTHGRDFAIAAGGALTSVVVALLLWKLESGLDFALYSFMLWFVLPAGALVSGLLAGSGYYFAARLLHARPAKLLRVLVVGISMAIFFVVHWLSYVSIVEGSQKLSDVVGYWDFLHFDLTHTSLTVGRGGHGLDTGELGAFGYLYAALQVAGFAYAGVFICQMLDALPFCDPCSLFMKKLGRRERYAADQRSIGVLKKEFGDLVAAGNAQEAVDRVAGFGAPKKGKYGYKAQLEHHRCTKCAVNRFALSSQNFDGKNWKDSGAVVTVLSPVKAALSA